jgi:hypothetical protein
METTERPVGKKPADDHLTKGTSQNTAQTGDGKARPLEPNRKEADPSMREDDNADAQTARSKRPGKR